MNQMQCTGWFFISSMLFLAGCSGGLPPNDLQIPKNEVFFGQSPDIPSSVDTAQWTNLSTFNALSVTRNSSHPSLALLETLRKSLIQVRKSMIPNTNGSSTDYSRSNTALTCESGGGSILVQGSHASITDSNSAIVNMAADFNNQTVVILQNCKIGPQTISGSLQLVGSMSFNLAANGDPTMVAQSMNFTVNGNLSLIASSGSTAQSLVLNDLSLDIPVGPNDYKIPATATSLRTMDFWNMTFDQVTSLATPARCKGHVVFGGVSANCGEFFKSYFISK